MRLAGLTALLMLGVVACDSAEGGRDKHGEPAAEATTAALPVLSLEGAEVKGGAFRLRDLRGEVVVLVFQRGVRCGLCRERLRSLSRYRSEYERLGARVVAVVPGPAEAWEAVADELDLTVPIIAVNRSTLERWGAWPPGAAAPLPAAFIIDESGRIEYRHVGVSAADRVGDLVLLAIVRRMPRGDGAGGTP